MTKKNSENNLLNVTVLDEIIQRDAKETILSYFLLMFLLLIRFAHLYSIENVYNK